MSTKRQCRTCRYIEPSYDKNGKRYMRRELAYICNAPTPITPLPDSITRTYHFVAAQDVRRRRMSPNDGSECPLWELREGA